jgi:hypothetical protein
MLLIVNTESQIHSQQVSCLRCCIGAFAITIAFTSIAPCAEMGREEAIKTAVEAAKAPAAAKDEEQERKFLEKYDQISKQATIRSACVLVFALIIFGAAIWLRKNRLMGQILVFKIIGLTLVVSAGLLLVVAGFSNEQITSMMGLLGTVAGYILGKGEEQAKRAGTGETPSKVPSSS